MVYNSGHIACEVFERKVRKTCSRVGGKHRRGKHYRLYAKCRNYGYCRSKGAFAETGNVLNCYESFLLHEFVILSIH